MLPNADMNLAKLERQAKYDLECLNYPARPWVKPKNYHGHTVKDVVIIGGGQSGLTLALNLRRDSVTNIAILDKNEAGFEGPWRNYARMHTLRTPKYVTGPDLDIGSLTVRAWWEARFGPKSWEELYKIPTLQWAEYLDWLRKVTNIEVSNRTVVSDIEPLEDDIFAVHIIRDGSKQQIYTRLVVLATGIEGSGQWVVPDIFKNNLPKSVYAHTAEAIDFDALQGKRVAVVGGGSSSFDNSATALEHGAKSVTHFVRRAILPSVNPYRFMEYSGFLRHFADLSDDQKWRFMKYLFDMNQPPTQDSYLRCTKFANYELKLASPIVDCAMDDKGILLKTPEESDHFDFLIVGTGLVIDLKTRPEIARFADKIETWGDHYTPPHGLENSVIATCPYLGENFQFCEKIKGEAPYLKRIFSYTFAGMPSLAASAGISALKFGVRRLAYGITSELFCEDADYHYDLLTAFDEKELTAAQPVSKQAV